MSATESLRNTELVDRARQITAAPAATSTNRNKNQRVFFMRRSVRTRPEGARERLPTRRCNL